MSGSSNKNTDIKNKLKQTQKKLNLINNEMFNQILSCTNAIYNSYVEMKEDREANIKDVEHELDRYNKLIDAIYRVSICLRLNISKSELEHIIQTPGENHRIEIAFGNNRIPDELNEEIWEILKEDLEGQGIE